MGDSIAEMEVTYWSITFRNLSKIGLQRACQGAERRAPISFISASNRITSIVLIRSLRRFTVRSHLSVPSPRISQTVAKIDHAVEHCQFSGSRSMSSILTSAPS